MDSEESNYKQQLIQAHKRRLRELELRSAEYGINCPAEVRIEIRRIEEIILDIQKDIGNDDGDESKTRGFRRKVLIIEDDLAAASFYSHVLSNRGYDILSKDDGLSGLEAVQNEIPDVVLLDLELPRMSGYNVLLEIVERKIPTRVVIVSAHIGKSVSVFIKAGACDCLYKPFGKEELIDTVEKAIKLSPTIDVISKYPLQIINPLLVKIDELNENNNNLRREIRELSKSSDAKSFINWLLRFRRRGR